MAATTLSQELQSPFLNSLEDQQPKQGGLYQVKEHFESPNLKDVRNSQISHTVVTTNSGSADVIRKSMQET